MSCGGSDRRSGGYHWTNRHGFIVRLRTLCWYLPQFTRQHITSSIYSLVRSLPKVAVLIRNSFYNIEKNQIRPELAVQIHFTQAGGITGHVMLLCMMLIYTTAHHRIRQQAFETFWYTHHLFIPFTLALYTHATGCFVRDTADPYSPFAGKEFWNHCLGYEGWRWELVAGSLYLLERLYREIRSRRETMITKVIRHPYGK